MGRVNFNELIRASVSGWDMDEQREAIAQIALAFNETLPTLPVFTKESRNLTSNNLRTVWEGPEELYQNSAGDDNFVVYQLLHGMIRPK